jgi:hypothetical protein
VPGFAPHLRNVRGDSLSLKNRDFIAQKMTAAEGQRLAREWKAETNPSK